MTEGFLTTMTFPCEQLFSPLKNKMLMMMMIRRGYQRPQTNKKEKLIEKATCTFAILKLDLIASLQDTNKRKQKSMFINMHLMPGSAGNS